MFDGTSSTFGESGKERAHERLNRFRPSEACSTPSPRRSTNRNAAAPLRPVLRVEDAVYRVMRDLAQEYRGGYWHFYELSNGGLYMAPQLGPLDIQIATLFF